MPIARRTSPPSSPRGLSLDVVQKVAAFTIDANMIEAVVQVTNGSGVTVTLPRDLPVGFYCYIEQGGAGAVTFSAATGATLVNRQSFVKTAGQYAMVSLTVRANTTGKSAQWVLNGDGST